MNAIEYRIKELTYILTPSFDLINKSPELHEELTNELNYLLKLIRFKE